MNNGILTIFILLFSLTAWSVAEEDVIYLKGIESQISQTLENKAQLSIEIEELKSRIVDIEKKLNRRKILIAQRIRASQSLQRSEWAEFLLDPDFNRVERNLRILKKLSEHDSKIFSEYHRTLSILKMSKKNLQDTEDQFSSSIEKLQKQQDEFFTLEQIRIESLQRSKTESLLLHKGKLARPLEGHLKVDYGATSDPTNLYYTFSRGVVYNSARNQTVRAIGLGKVIFSDVLPHWGKTLIVQHDDNYYSVYSAITDIKKSVGDSVAQGEAIAKAARAEFYFELRHFDNPINPSGWFTERKK